MSLCCGQCLVTMQYGSLLRVVQFAENPTIVAVCKGCLDKVPHDCQADPQAPGGYNVTFYEGRANRNFITENYAWTGMKAGKAIFSIKPPDLLRFLPNIGVILKDAVLDDCSPAPPVQP